MRGQLHRQELIDRFARVVDEQGAISLSATEIEGLRYAMQRVMGFGADTRFIGAMDHEMVARNALPSDATNRDRAIFALKLEYIVAGPTRPCPRCTAEDWETLYGELSDAGLFTPEECNICADPEE